MERLKNIPEDVVNVKQYKKMVALQNHPLLRNSIYIASDGSEINFAMLPHRLKKFIEHLSPKEQEHVMELKRQYNVIRAKITSATAAAYGRSGSYGGLKRQEYEAKRLTPFEEDVVELLGRLFTTTEVVKIMGEDYGIEVEEKEVKRIFKKHITEIERKREEFRNRVTDVRLYSKRPRLEELAWMYGKMKTRYVALNNVESYNAMLRTLEQIRKEAEGDILNINSVLDVNVEVEIQNRIQQEILKTINLKEIILSRVAARMNYDPYKLIAGLHNSYYSKFVVISGDYDPNAAMQYPSAVDYDFTKIEQQTDQTTVQLAPEPLPEKELVSAQRTKELFLEKIRQQKQKEEARQAGWDFDAERKRLKAEDEEIFNREKKGRGKDKIPPSQTKAGQYKQRNRDYRTGVKVKKNK